ncbi:electron transfer flavoprotein subunit beta/FixA family protein [Paenibacillus sp. ACRRX]|uniref:electron transfer flavoprotein subunit beta/FixA family protein n=1 Tax=unclassified Paenibacillus TaxID=185978 RepID=UPI001EF63BAD|nr:MULTISPECIES: electron transfer flavoprotein subunit beta/FixA family protein [unclassified Paenibacillus]MCG7407406.1 electron transfer flavoprotein subunit beta/FixA family protein [Paenibacillus sp. ACRRX]MDK8180642.1 electron transfer flavoprotein subunit beta/FixA family protein [Paenibacillus sp. UMB4589-SE434]
MTFLSNESAHSPLDIVVLLKQTFDTEERVSIVNGQVSQDGVKWVINPYDEYAVEEALRWKEAYGGKVTVISVGPERCAEALRTALAMGADEAVLIHVESSAAEQLDEHVVSSLLYAALKDQPPQLLLAGHFSVDQGSAQVAIRLSVLLDIPHVSAITKLERMEGQRAKADRDAEGDTERLEVTLPALFTAQQGLNEPRYPSLPGIMKAKKKPLTQIDAMTLCPDFSQAAGTLRTSIELPPPRLSGKLFAGSPAEQVEQLIRSLRDEAKCIG